MCYCLGAPADRSIAIVALFVERQNAPREVKAASRAPQSVWAHAGIHAASGGAVLHMGQSPTPEGWGHPAGFSSDVRPSPRPVRLCHVLRRDEKAGPLPSRERGIGRAPALRVRVGHPPPVPLPWRERGIGRSLPASSCGLRRDKSGFVLWTTPRQVRFAFESDTLTPSLSLEGEGDWVLASGFVLRTTPGQVGLRPADYAGTSPASFCGLRRDRCASRSIAGRRFAACEAGEATTRLG